MKWLHTDQLYRQMINAQNDAQREQLYREQLLAPMAKTFEIAHQRMPIPTDNEKPTDLMDIARQWFWRLPEDFRTEPDDMHYLTEVDAWNKSEKALQEAIERFLPYQNRVHVETDVMGVLLLTKPVPFVPVGGGYAGLQMDGCCIVTYHEPSAENVQYAHGAMAHEFNHRIRSHAFPWAMGVTDLAEYVVMEGLAESFAVDLYGENVLGFYVTHVSNENLDIAKKLVQRDLQSTQFDVMRSHIFGDTITQAMGGKSIGMPDFGGYAVGYHIVQAYLQAMGDSIEEATLTSARMIIDRSGYFA